VRLGIKICQLIEDKLAILMDLFTLTFHAGCKGQIKIMPKPEHGRKAQA